MGHYNWMLCRRRDTSNGQTLFLATYLHRITKSLKYCPPFAHITYSVFTYAMAFGVLDPKHGHHVPGTVNLDDQATSDNTEATSRSLKHATGKNSHIVLVPQPSDDPNDPLNWTLLKRNLVFGVIMLGTAFVGIVPVCSYDLGILMLLQAIQSNSELF